MALRWFVPLDTKNRHARVYENSTRKLFKRTNACTFLNKFLLKHASLFRTHAQVWLIRIKCDFNTHECNLCKQSVISTRISVITTRTIMISTRWVWFLQPEKVRIQQCNFYTHECDFDSNESDLCKKSVISTRISVITKRTSVIYTRWVWFSHLECDYNTN
jgi:hypothetical protein